MSQSQIDSLEERVLELEEQLLSALEQNAKIKNWIKDNLGPVCCFILLFIVSF